MPTTVLRTVSRLATLDEQRLPPAAMALRREQERTSGILSGRGRGQRRRKQTAENRCREKDREENCLPSVSDRDPVQRCSSRWPSEREEAQAKIKE